MASPPPANVYLFLSRAMVACMYVISLILQAVVVNSQSPATLSVPNVIPGATATFKCSLPSLTSPISIDIYKDNVSVYQCLNIAFTCSKASLDTDYSDVKFTALGTMLAKGTFTVTNADQTRDGGEWTCQYGSSLISSPVTFVVSGPAILSVTNVLQGATATFECSYPSLTSPTTLNIYKDGLALYQCTDIASTCSKSSTDSDYSDVRLTNLGTASAKGTFTVANADQTRVGGEWTCKYGTSLISSSFTFVETDDSWCSSNIGSCFGAIFGWIIACILMVLIECWCWFLCHKTFAPTGKPKGLLPMKRVSPTDTPTPGHEETHNEPGPLPSDTNVTGIPKSSFEPELDPLLLKFQPSGDV